MTSPEDGAGGDTESDQSVPYRSAPHQFWLPARKLWRLSRPRFWIYVFGPFLVGLAAGGATPASLASLQVLAWALYFSFPANLLIYGVNDIFDWETDRQNEKKNTYETLVPPDERGDLWRAIAIWNLPFVPLFTTAPLNALAALAAFLFFAIFYSAPPIRAKARPLLDSLFNTLYICPGAFAYLLVGGPNFSWPLYGAATAWAMAMHAYSAIPDIDADRDAGLSTVATWLGPHGTLAFCAVSYLTAAAIAFFAMGHAALILGAVYVALMAISWQAHRAGRIFAIYKYFPAVNTACGFLLFCWVAMKHWNPQ